MRMLEGKKLEHKPTMKKLADVTPKESRGRYADCCVSRYGYMYGSLIKEVQDD